MSTMKIVREFCRRRAVELVEQGESRDVIARVLGVSRGSISMWWRMACAGEDLAGKPVKGRPRCLDDKQLEELAELLKKGAEAHGWQNNLWTSLRVAEVIKRHFGVECHRCTVWHILTDRLHWKAKRPVQQLKSRDDDKIQCWVRETFPRIVREAAEKREFLVFVDETGFMMYSTVRKTFAPPGETPVNKVTDPHGRISTIGAIAMSPEDKTLGWHYYMLEKNTNFRGPAVVDFLKRLRNAIPGPIAIVWDQIIIHSCTAVEEYMSTNPGIRFEPFPPYAPELNPVDRAWFYIKYDRIPNYAPASTDLLRKTVGKELRRLQTRPQLLESFIKQSKLPRFL
jgi:transposase